MVRKRSNTKYRHISAHWFYFCNI